jgi:hypothetical protein
MRNNKNVQKTKYSKYSKYYKYFLIFGFICGLVSLSIILYLQFKPKLKNEWAEITKITCDVKGQKCVYTLTYFDNTQQVKYINGFYKDYKVGDHLNIYIDNKGSVSLQNDDDTTLKIIQLVCFIIFVAIYAPYAPFILII